MTLIKTGFGISQLSGKIGDTVFSRNRGGAYAKTRSNPVQPSTGDQTDKWAIWTDSANAYKNLNAQQIQMWSEYAKGITGSNRLGEPIRLTGQQVFTECFTNASLVGYDPLLEPRQWTNRPSVSSVFGLWASSNGYKLTLLAVNHTTYESPSGWGIQQLISAAPVQRPSVRNVNNQFRLIDTTTATGIHYITDPYIAKFTNAGLPGQIAHLRIRAVDVGNFLGSTTILINGEVTYDP